MRLALLCLLSLPVAAQVSPVPAGWGIQARDGVTVTVSFQARPATMPDCVPRTARPCPLLPVVSQTAVIVLVRNQVPIVTLQQATWQSNVAKVFTIADNRVRNGDWIAVELSPTLIRPEECSGQGPVPGAVPPYHECPCYSCRGPTLNGQKPPAMWYVNMK